MTIRQTTARDWPALWPLLRDMGSTDSEAATGARLAHLRRRQEHYLPVAVIGRDLAGYAWAHDYGPHLRAGLRTARLNDLYVAPPWRLRGVGQALLRAVVAWADARGVRWLQWQASETAVPFYERLGLAGDPCPDPGHPFFEIDFTMGHPL